MEAGRRSDCYLWLPPEAQEGKREEKRLDAAGVEAGIQVPAQALRHVMPGDTVAHALPVAATCFGQRRHALRRQQAVRRHRDRHQL